MAEVLIFVDGVPVAQPRQRHSARPMSDGRIAVRNYTPKKHPVQEWKRRVRFISMAVLSARGLGPFDSQIAVDLFFVFPRPKSKTRATKQNQRYWKGTKPDKDNLAKAVFDSLEGVAWKNDCIVVQGDVSKVVAGDGDTPGVAIRIRNPEQVVWPEELIGGLSDV